MTGYIARVKYAMVVVTTGQIFLTFCITIAHIGALIYELSIHISQDNLSIINIVY